MLRGERKVFCSECPPPSDKKGSQWKANGQMALNLHCPPPSGGAARRTLSPAPFLSLNIRNFEQNLPNELKRKEINGGGCAKGQIAINWTFSTNWPNN